MNTKVLRVTTEQLETIEKAALPCEPRHKALARLLGRKDALEAAAALAVEALRTGGPPSVAITYLEDALIGDLPPT